MRSLFSVIFFRFGKSRTRQNSTKTHKKGVGVVPLVDSDVLVEKRGAQWKSGDLVSKSFSPQTVPFSKVTFQIVRCTEGDVYELHGVVYIRSRREDAHTA